MKGGPRKSVWSVERLTGPVRRQRPREEPREVDLQPLGPRWCYWCGKSHGVEECEERRMALERRGQDTSKRKPPVNYALRAGQTSTRKRLLNNIRGASAGDRQ